MILLDTHTLIWLASDPAKLSSMARDTIAAHAGAMYCSVVSTWEVALLMKRGRLSLPLHVKSFMEKAIAHHGLIELPLDREVILASVALADIHNDPFDRILIAECQRGGFTLVSKDRIIPAYPGICVVW